MEKLVEEESVNIHWNSTWSLGNKGQGDLDYVGFRILMYSVF